jgi:glycosyltransferase involved in cell wall biosynthesis
MQNNGDVVLWCDSAAQEAKKWLPEWDFNYIYFGADHADFRPYSIEERQMLRHKVGFDDYFIIGSFGVNKRTKGFPTLIYAATCLKEWGYEDKIRFYCHTDPLNPVMQGHHLVDLADRHGVGKMFLWKPDNNHQKRGNQYIGDNRNDDTLDRVKSIRKPSSSNGRKELWTSYDFISKMNCMDIYCDTSQVEGAGLPQLEAMVCGVPLISVHDYHVRDEWYGDVACMMNPLPLDQWETWHTGARLVTIDPMEVAKSIERMYQSEELREQVTMKGLNRTNEFKWADTQQAMNRKVMELYDR